MIHWIEVFDRKLAHLIRWLALIMVIVMFSVVVLRYGFNLGWIAMQESVFYMNAFMVMLGLSYTYQVNDHVRVDIFYNSYNPKKRAWVDIVTVFFFLWPFMGFTFYASWDYVVESIQLREASPDAGGIPGVYWLKSLILVMPLLMSLQGLVVVAKAWSIIRGKA